MMLPSDRWELAMRYDDYDDVQTPMNFDRSLFTFGANYYVSGHDVKWQINYAYGENKGIVDGPSTNLVAIGLTIGF